MKISFVTAAMLYLSRRARHSCSIRAVLPDPTGLFAKWWSALFGLKLCELVCLLEGPGVPTNSYGEGPLGPVPALDDWHLAFGEGAWTVKRFVRVSMFGGIEVVGVGVGAEPVVGV